MGGIVLCIFMVSLGFLVEPGDVDEVPNILAST